MSMIPWKPFGDMDHFLQDDHWFLPVFPRFDEPAMDMFETDSAVIAKINLPGMDPEKIEVYVEDGILHLSGTREEKSEEKEKGYWRREIREGSFERAVRLPLAVKEDAIEATYEKGVLKITMPKETSSKEKGKKIRITVT